MAVAPTGAIYKALKFDGVSSRTYGVYITGEAVYNAPERDVNMITIPGRSGSFALDNGRFQNIEVSYPAGIFAETEADFRKAISDFRNFLCSRKGYVRLTDEYNPNEYRMAVYKSGLEVEPAQLRAGEFAITFDCKPQRWLTSGESAVTIANSGDTITNPTLFDASPLLEVTGYGDVDINGETVSIGNNTLGTVIVNNGESTKSRTYPFTNTFSPGLELLNNGDEFRIESIFAEFQIQYKTQGVSSWNVDSTYGPVSGAITSTSGGTVVRIELSPQTLTKGTSISDVIGNVNFSISSASQTSSPIFGLTLQYSGGDSITITASRQSLGSFTLMNVLFGYEMMTGSSSKSALGNPTYFDLKTGEVYGTISGKTVSLNNVAEISAIMPILAPGSNTITYDNTVTKLEIVPRWWKV